MKNCILKISFVFCVLWTAVTPLLAQKNVHTRKVSVGAYVEVGGSCGFYSVNIEPRVKLEPQHTVGIRAGISDYSGGQNLLFVSSRVSVTAVPVLATYSWQPNAEYNHFLEFGVGKVFASWEESVNTLLIGGDISTKYFKTSATTLNVGYRYQNPKGFMFKAGVATFTNVKGKALTLPAVSVGYTF